MRTALELLQPECLEDLLRRYVTPLSPYFLASHFIATELQEESPKYVQCGLDVPANDFLRNPDVSQIADLDVVQVQVDLLAYFIADVLPHVRKAGKRIILITSQWWLPAVHRSWDTDGLLADPAIALWVSQNPIYPTAEKYMAFPYGLCHLTLREYAATCHALDQTVPRDTQICNPPSTVHPHLPADHVRRRFARLGRDSGPTLPYDQYLAMIRRSCYAISTEGDRPDTYRHYECLGLGARPLSSVPSTYQAIFGDDMVVRHADELPFLLDHPELLPPYHPPDRARLLLSYWSKQIESRVAALRH